MGQKLKKDPAAEKMGNTRHCESSEVEFYSFYNFRLHALEFTPFILIIFKTSYNSGSGGGERIRDCVHSSIKYMQIRGEATQNVRTGTSEPKRKERDE